MVNRRQSTSPIEDSINEIYHGLIRFGKSYFHSIFKIQGLFSHIEKCTNKEGEEEKYIDPFFYIIICSLPSLWIIRILNYSSYNKLKIESLTAIDDYVKNSSFLSKILHFSPLLAFLYILAFFIAIQSGLIGKIISQIKKKYCYIKFLIKYKFKYNYAFFKSRYQTYICNDISSKTARNILLYLFGSYLLTHSLIGIIKKSLPSISIYIDASLIITIIFFFMISIQSFVFFTERIKKNVDFDNVQSTKHFYNSLWKSLKQSKHKFRALIWCAFITISTYMILPFTKLFLHTLFEITGQLEYKSNVLLYNDKINSNIIINKSSVAKDILLSGSVYISNNSQSEILIPLDVALIVYIKNGNDSLIFSIDMTDNSKTNYQSISENIFKNIKIKTLMDTSKFKILRPLLIQNKDNFFYAKINYYTKNKVEEEYCQPIKLEIKNL